MLGCRPGSTAIIQCSTGGETKTVARSACTLYYYYRYHTRRLRWNTVVCRRHALTRRCIDTQTGCVHFATTSPPRPLMDSARHRPRVFSIVTIFFFSATRMIQHMGVKKKKKYYVNSHSEKKKIGSVHNRISWRTVFFLSFTWRVFRI